MGEPALQQRLFTVEEFVAHELTSPRRHEFVSGMIYALSGVSRRHSRIAMNVGHQWQLQVLEGEGTISAPCPELTITLAEIYHGIE